MTVAIHVCTSIAAPPERVWDVVEGIEQHTEWMTDAERITFVSDARRGVGTEFDCLTRVGPLRLTDRMVVTEWEPGAAMGIEHRGVVSGRGRFTLAAERDATRFCWDEALHFPWWMGGPAGEQAAKPVLRKLWRANLERLRTIAETGAERDREERE